MFRIKRCVSPNMLLQELTAHNTIHRTPTKNDILLLISWGCGAAAIISTVNTRPTILASGSHPIIQVAQPQNKRASFLTQLSFDPVTMNLRTPSGKIKNHCQQVRTVVKQENQFKATTRTSSLAIRASGIRPGQEFSRHPSLRCSRLVSVCVTVKKSPFQY